MKEERGKRNNPNGKRLSAIPQHTRQATASWRYRVCLLYIFNTESHLIARLEIGDCEDLGVPLFISVI